MVNPHKWLFTPFDGQYLYCRDLGSDEQAFSWCPNFSKQATRRQ
jgi:hypothetical protein